MIYLITGSNGAGKTLNALKWIRERQLKENRPVCHNGRFEIIPGGELESWKQIDIKTWQEQPPGTIFLVDECHNDFPVRSPSAAVPDYVRMLAEHRRFGFDFYLITQHPNQFDLFIRRLIGPPGWHRHLKRAFGGDLVSVIEWGAANTNCEKSGSGKSGAVTMQAFPKEVYSWYKSASLHTVKKKIPKMVWVFLAAIVLVPIMLYIAYINLMGIGKTNDNPSLSVPGVMASSSPGHKNSTPEISTAVYLEQRTPRLEGFPHTAPVYDKVTAPTEAPYPAACVAMSGKCKCYTQQATLMQVSEQNCKDIVKYGFFMDWKAKDKPDREKREEKPRDEDHKVVSVPMPEAVKEQSGFITQSDIPAVLALRRPSMAAYQ